MTKYDKTMPQSTLSETSTRLSPSLLSDVQQEAIDAAYQGEKLIYGKMGAGKTVVLATAITELLDDKELSRVLIVTTPTIANTVWKQEFNKWEHTWHIKVGRATKHADQRLSIIKDKTRQVVVVSFNNLKWMKDNRLFQHFDGLLIDESTKLATPSSVGFKALRPHLKNFKWRVALTGTPVNEHFQKLYSQIMLVDLGKAFGTRKDEFLTTYFYPTDFKQYKWALKEGADKLIMGRIKPLIHEMADYRDELPELKEHKIKLTMPESLRTVYNAIAKKGVYEDVKAPTVLVKETKLQQLVSGFLYDDELNTRRFSCFRFDALLKKLSKIEGNVIIYYWYATDRDKLIELLPKLKLFNEENVVKWNQGEIKYLGLHPRSASHGVQLEQGGHTIVWFNNVNSNDLREQANARVWRKGQKHPVDIYSFEVEDSIDEVMNMRVKTKQEYDKLFAKHLKGK